MEFSAEETVLVVSGGVVSDGVVSGGVDSLDGVAVPPARAVIAADSGASAAHALGLRVDVLIGDLDSVPDADRKLVADRGGEIRSYPVAKDATDLELALGYAAGLRPRPRRIVVLGGTGGRFDHLLAGTLLLAAPAWDGVPVDRIHVEARLGGTVVTVIRSQVTLAGSPGDLLTLLAVRGVAYGVRTEGLRYPLRTEDLLPGSTRGVSNEFIAGQARVSLTGGTLLAIHPS